MISPYCVCIAFVLCYRDFELVWCACHLAIDMQTDSQTEFLNDPLPTLLPLIRVTALNGPLAHHIWNYICMYKVKWQLITMIKGTSEHLILVVCTWLFGGSGSCTLCDVCIYNSDEHMYAPFWLIRFSMHESSFFRFVLILTAIPASIILCHVAFFPIIYSLVSHFCESYL